MRASRVAATFWAERQTGCDSRPPGTGWTILRQAGRAQQGRATGRREASNLWIVCLLPEESGARWAAVATAVEEEEEEEEEEGDLTALGIQILQSLSLPLPH
ncbi:hypothetical protein PAMP_004832 [Pampus punctatissimus]